MKNTFKKILLAAALPLSLQTTLGYSQTFTPVSGSIIESTFPYSYVNYPTGSHTPTVPPPLDFYYNRTCGSAYHNTTDALFGTDVDIYLWGYSHDLLDGFNAGVAYRITAPNDTVTLYRGLNAVGDDFAETQVGMYRANSKVYVVTFSWDAAAGPTLNFFDLLPATDGLVPSSGLGGAPPAVQSVAPLWSPTGHSQHLAMDSHDMNCFAIAWEAPGIGIFVRAYRVNAFGVLEQSSGTGSITGFPDLTIPFSNAGRLPDLAITHDIGSGKRAIQLAFVDTAALQIREYSIDLDQLFLTPTPGVIPEDFYAISKFNHGWDEFQLSIDAPDHFTPAGLTNSWSYTYYNNDNNNINVRVCDGTVSPATITSYVTNDGSLGNLAINSAGNAFPTIAYDNTGNELMVGWYTTYDPAMATRPLYNYTTPLSTADGGRRYVALRMTTGGGITGLNDYMDVESKRLDNWIGMVGFGRPGITFSKHNDGAHLFTTFNYHGPSAPWTQTTNFVGRALAEGDNCGGSVPMGSYISSSGNIGNALFYYDGGCTYTLGSSLGFEARVIDHKMIPWSSTSFFGPTSATPKFNHVGVLSIQNNPFNEENLFSIKCDNCDEVLSVVFSTIDGRQIGRFNGTILEVNKQIQSLKLLGLPDGSYLLNIDRDSGEREYHKLVKL